MTIFYRICDIASTNPSPVFQDDKFSLNKWCLMSFVEAFREVNPKMVFICDFCPKENYEQLIQEVVPFEKEIHFTEIGISGTCLMQYEMAKECGDDVLFQECDYLYVPQSGKDFVNAVKKLNLVSPYDHPNFYKDRTMHSNKCEIELVDDIHYRTAERNTMTFGMTQKALEDNLESLMRWGHLDNEVWGELRANGYKLYVPIPSFATHLVKDLLAPSVNW